VREGPTSKFVDDEYKHSRAVDLVPVHHVETVSKTDEREKTDNVSEPNDSPTLFHEVERILHSLRRLSSFVVSSVRF